MDELPIGRRVAYWRSRRNMSQQQFADTLGKSKSWVDKVERGARALDKLSTLQTVADALGIELRLLLGENAERKRTGEWLDAARIDAVRGALSRWGPARLGQAQPRLTIGDLGKAVNHAWLSYQHARYAELVRSLPRLLLDAQQVRAANPDVAEAAQRLAEAYQITSAVMRKVGPADLAWLAADRALTASQDADDHLLTGVCAAQLGYALLSQGQARHAMEVTIALAHQIAGPDPLDAPADHLSVHGTLLITAALGAATLGHVACAAELIGQAGEAAAIVDDGQNHYWTAFGPITVELARITAAIALGRGVDRVEHQQLVEHAAFRGLPPERRADYLVEAARGYLGAGDLVRAGKTLVSAERAAPAEIRNRPLGHELLAALLRRSPAASLDVLRLADELGVRV
ncbi:MULTISPECIES: helix-turn-helix domain-containing protein [Micromonospora]|uniref:helix-turn-helix domain-containing protein n=1 Tax=Micromonospora TaxID=1873 RepID=UPI001E494E21|nr:helix-turn-helix domain-containing protein [Micromonospora sp. NBRC 110038]